MRCAEAGLRDRAALGREGRAEPGAWAAQGRARGGKRSRAGAELGLQSSGGFVTDGMFYPCTGTPTGTPSLIPPRGNCWLLSGCVYLVALRNMVINAVHFPVVLPDKLC